MFSRRVEVLAWSGRKRVLRKGHLWWWMKNRRDQVSSLRSIFKRIDGLSDYIFVCKSFPGQDVIGAYDFRHGFTLLQAEAIVSIQAGFLLLAYGMPLAE